MKYIFSLIAAILIFTSCERIEADGPITSREHLISLYAQHIDVSSTATLVLTDQVEPGVIIVETNDNVHRYVEVSSRSSRIKIDRANKIYDNDISFTIFASSEQFCHITASGSSQVVTEGRAYIFDNCSLDLSGSSRFNGHLAALGGIEIEISGASTANVTGEAEYCELELSGASRFYGRNFSCYDLDVEIAGASRADIIAHSLVTGEISGASTLTNYGNAIIDVQLNGGSQVNHPR